MKPIMFAAACLTCTMAIGQKVGIGTTAPQAGLQIQLNSTMGTLDGAQLLLMEDENDFARLRLTNSLYNAGTNNRYWDIAGRIDASATGVGSLLNFYREGFGNVLSLRGNGWVGIGAEPIVPLHVQTSQSGLTAAFLGGAQMYMGFYEEGNYRGYLGSFAGNAQDVDFGTGAGNTTGKVHLTIQSQPRLTIRENGYVGINTLNPQWHLDVEGGMRLNGRFFINGTSGSAGQVLTSGGLTNTPSWQTLNTAYSNDVRFAVSTTQNTIGNTTTNSRTVLYNTNTTAIATPTSGSITIAQPGLYHLEGNFTVSVEYAGQTVANNTNATGRLVLGVSEFFNTHYITEFKRIGTGSNWRGQDVFTWTKDIYITPAQVPISVSYGYVFNFSPTNGASLVNRSMTGTLSGYKIAD